MDDKYKFPLHHNFVDKEEEDNEEDTEGSGSDSKSAALTTPIHNKIHCGDWVINLKTLKMKNIKQDVKIDLKKLNSHSLYLKLFCTVGIHPDWDIHGLISVLNQAAQIRFEESIDQVLAQSVENKGKVINWKEGTLSGQKVKPNNSKK